MTTVLDSWAVMSYLQNEEPASHRAPCRQLALALGGPAPVAGLTGTLDVIAAKARGYGV